MSGFVSTTDYTCLAPVAPVVTHKVKVFDPVTMQVGTCTVAELAAAQAGTCVLKLPLHEWHPTASLKDALADTASGTLMGLADAVTGVLVGLTTNGGATATGTSNASRLVTLPPYYKAGTNITFSASAGLSAARAGAAPAQTVDLVAKQVVANTVVANQEGADLCATAAQAITATAAAKSFTITGATLSPGDVLHLTLTLATDDTGGSTDGYPAVSSTSISFVGAH